MNQSQANFSKQDSATGKVESISDGICVISGINRVAIDSVVSFPSGCTGWVIDFDNEYCSALVFGDFTTIKKGDYARVVEDQLKVPVGDELLGRIIDPLGNPMDEKGAVLCKEEVTLENKNKNVFERRGITEQLETGYVLIDSQIPIGKGQRELFIGEKRIGKEETASNIFINQAANSPDMIVIFVTIGAQTSFVKRVVESIAKTNAGKNTLVVVGRASDSASLNYLAPLSAIRIAEEFASRGKDVLIIFDNMTRHARIYRQISLLLKRAPGREAYPGDIFYLHAKLLERCGRFGDEVGGGSITAIPIVETVGEDITDYITTNLMSITDGHVLFLRSLYHKDRRPAISVEYSVSRIGGRAQKAVFRDLSNELKTKIGRFNELEALANFGAELQKETAEIIERGKRIFAFINQDRSTNIRIDEQCAVIYLLLSDYILGWPSEAMGDLMVGFLKFLSRPENIQKITNAFAKESLVEAKQIYEELSKAFYDDTETIRPLSRGEKPADKESLNDLLKQMEQTSADTR